MESSTTCSSVDAEATNRPIATICDAIPTMAIGPACWATVHELVEHSVLTVNDAQVEAARAPQRVRARDRVPTCALVHMCALARGVCACARARAGGQASRAWCASVYWQAGTTARAPGLHWVAGHALRLRAPQDGHRAGASLATQPPRPVARPVVSRSIWSVPCASR